MKNTVKIAGILMILLLAGSNLAAQRGMRGFRSDTVSMNQRRDSIRMQMSARRRSMNMDSTRWGMRHPGGMTQGMMNHHGYRGYMPYNSDRNINRMRQPFSGNFGNRRQGMMAYGRGMGDLRQNMPGRMIMESMPGVTQQQKDELAKLNDNQREEMQKLRDKQQEAVKALRDEHRKKVMNILTDDQKKWLEENALQGGEK
jgi:hypothetical protein